MFIFYISIVCCADSILLLSPSLPREQFLLPPDENSSISFSRQNYPHIWGKGGGRKMSSNILFSFCFHRVWDCCGPPQVSNKTIFGHVHPFQYFVSNRLAMLLAAAMLGWLLSSLLLICGRIHYRWISGPWPGLCGRVMANLIGGRRGVCQ